MLNIDYIRLLINYDLINEYIKHKLGIINDDKDVIELIKSFILLSFTPYDKGIENKLAAYINNIDFIMNKLFEDEDIRNNIHSDINRLIKNNIKLFITKYDTFKEIDKCIIDIEYISGLDFILTLDPRIISYEK